MTAAAVRSSTTIVEVPENPRHPAREGASPAVSVIRYVPAVFIPDKQQEHAIAFPRIARPSDGIRPLGSDIGSSCTSDVLPEKGFYLRRFCRLSRRVRFGHAASPLGRVYSRACTAGSGRSNVQAGPRRCEGDTGRAPSTDAPGVPRSRSRPRTPVAIRSLAKPTSEVSRAQTRGQSASPSRLSRKTGK